MDDFSQVKVGDRLWLLGRTYRGWVTVSYIYFTRDSPLGVKKLDGTFLGSFKYTGQHTEGGPQCLFWDEVIIIPPPKPKRMVTKTLEGYVNVYPTHTGIYFYPTEKAAKAENDVEVEVLATVKVTSTYEVEE